MATAVSTGITNKYPAIASDENGKVYIATSYYHSGYYHIGLYTKSPDDSSFTYTEIGTDNEEYKGIDIACNSSGSVGLTYTTYNSSTNIYGLRYYLSSDYGSTWSVDGISETYEVYNPSISIDDKGSIIIVYETLYDGVIPRLYEVHKLYDEDDWSSSTSVNGYLPLISFKDEDLSGSEDSWADNGTSTSTLQSSVTYGRGDCYSLTNSDGSNYTYKTFPSLDGITGAEYYVVYVAMRAASGSATTQFVWTERTVSFTTAITNEWEFFYTVLDKEFVENSTESQIRIFNNSTSDTCYYSAVGVAAISNKEYPQRYANSLIDPDFKKGQVSILYSEDNSPLVSVRINTHNVLNGLDITDDVQSLRVSRNKEFKTGKYGAGDFSISLDNSSGLYTNEDNSSPLFKKLKSGIEVNIDLGTRTLISGMPTNPDNWREELFPEIVGVASKFSSNSRNETFTISGRDRADKLMSYRNYTSELYESKQALELISELANEDSDGDGIGDSDPRRPFIPLSEDASQQTLTAWERPLLSYAGKSYGDVGDSDITKTIIKTADIKSNLPSGTTIGGIAGVWIDRSDSSDYLWTMTAAPSGLGIYLNKWDNWKSSDGSAIQHISRVDIQSLFGSYVGMNGNKPISVSAYDEDHDAVWVQYYYETGVSGGGEAYLKLAMLDFKAATFVAEYTLGHWNPASGAPAYARYPGAVVYDSENENIILYNLYDRAPDGTGTGNPVYIKISATGTIAFSSPFSDNSHPETMFPTCSIKMNDYYFKVLGYQYEYTSGSWRNYNSLGALKKDYVDTYRLDSISGEYFNTAMCWVTNDYTSWSTSLKAAGTDEEFFTNTSTQNKPIVSIDYTDDMLYMFTLDNDESGYFDQDITNGIEIRALGSRSYYTPTTNVSSSEHTIANGYEEDSTEYIWFPIEEVKAKNEDITIELNTDSYDSIGNMILSGTGSILTTPTVSEEDYRINLETGEIVMSYFFDKKNKLVASYDYKYAVPYAWFEDTSIWDAVQEVASAGDYVCYVNEEGSLEFKDRHRYYYPKPSDYFINIHQEFGWTSTDYYTFTDSDGNAITNIIPGLEFVMSVNPNKDTGKFTTYKRKTYITNGVIHYSTNGDYDIDYDNGRISFSSSSFNSDERVMIYFYNKDYLFKYSYDSNITNLTYSWGADSIANRVTVKGERYYPSESPISVRQVYTVSPGERVVNTKFASIKQLSVGTGATDITQKQYDEYLEAWKAQDGEPLIDFEFRTKMLGDTAKSRESGKYIRVRALPCESPSNWDSTSSPEEIPTSARIGNGWKINWDSAGDTGVIPNYSDKSLLNVTGIEVKADGLEITVDYLGNGDEQYFVQVEIEGYTLTRVAKITALHEDYSSMLKYMTKSYELDNKFISDLDAAKLRARLLCNELSEENPSIGIEVLGSPFIQLEDIVLVRDINSGLYGDYFEVIAIDHNVSKDKYITKLKLRKLLEVTKDNLGYDNPITSYALEGYIDKTAMPIETFVEFSE